MILNTWFHLELCREYRKHMIGFLDIKKVLLATAGKEKEVHLDEAIDFDKSVKVGKKEGGQRCRQDGRLGI
eukprot:2789818-Ditylum_brightwellii.AAC.1